MTSPPPRDGGARRLLRAKVREVFRHLPKALSGDAEAVHQMRVAARRLRVALPLLSLRPDGRRVRRAVTLLRDLTRAAGASRDLDVMLEIVTAALPRPRSAEQSALVLRL